MKYSFRKSHICGFKIIWNCDL